MKRIALLTASVCLTLLGGCDSGSGNASANPVAEPAAKTAPAPAAESGGAKIERKYTQAVKERQSVFTLILKNFGPLGGMARGRAPFNAEVVQKNSVHLQHLGAMIGDTFTTDTRGTGVKTDALDAVWDDQEAFAKKIAAFQSAVDALADVASTGDESKIKPSIGRVGKACGSCHDDFKVDDD
ncbi:MAG: cytochrome c [Gammaproteobacteria bacterium]